MTSGRCKKCPPGGRCERCKARDRYRQRAYRGGIPRKLAKQIAFEIIRLATTGIDDDPYLLPDDGLIDPLAVEIVIYGERRIALTHAERLAAATALVQRRGTARMISMRLSLPRIITESECLNSTVPVLRSFASYGI